MYHRLAETPGKGTAMSVTLTVDFGRDLLLETVLAETRTAMTELLRISAPRVSVVDRQGAPVWYDAQQPFSVEGEVWRFATEDPSCLVFCTVSSIPEMPTSAMIEVGGRRETMGYALAAALAITIARLTCRVVIDEESAWVEGYENPVEEFVTRLRVREPRVDVLSASELFWSGMWMFRA